MNRIEFLPIESHLQGGKMTFWITLDSVYINCTIVHNVLLI